MSTGPSTTVAYRPFTALTYYILWLSSALSTKCAVLIHYATVVLAGPAGDPSHASVDPSLRAQEIRSQAVQQGLSPQPVNLIVTAQVSVGSGNPEICDQ